MLIMTVHFCYPISHLSNVAYCLAISLSMFRALSQPVKVSNFLNYIVTNIYFSRQHITAVWINCALDQKAPILMMTLCPLMVD